MSKVILILGGAGAQNSAVARELVKNESFSVKLLSRNAESEESVSLAAIPRLSVIEGDCYDEDTLISAFEGVNAVFVNTNGFAIGEKAELFWGIRMYEIAYWAGVTHFIYSSLPYVSKKSGFNPKYRVPFVDGKAKVVGKKLNHICFSCLSKINTKLSSFLRLLEGSANRQGELECNRKRPLSRGPP